MGRVSKRGGSATNTDGKRIQSVPKGRRLQAGIYARLSADQGNKACGEVKKNESIEVQIEIAKKFVEEYNGREAGEVIDVVRCYTDLGKTGSNFEREGFQRLMQDIRLGEINCVIVKDLSRFGRNYLEAGNYIEKIFPFLGVRFIAVADGFDTGKEGNENRHMASEIKNLVNDMYAKDFSKKAKLHLKQRREEGSYVGGPAPYGYQAKWQEKRRILIPDENTESIVRLIYEKFVETESYAAVVDELNRRRVNPPSLYKKTKEVYHAAGDADYKGWDKSAVETILKSETYVGTLVQGKTGMTARDERNRIYKPEAAWVVKKDAHEPIIDWELYRKAAAVCEKIRKRTASRKHTANGYPNEENIFDGVLYCGVCGKKMTRQSHIKQYANGEKTRTNAYFCLNSAHTKTMVCPDSNRISKRELVDILLPLLRMEYAVFLNKPKSMEYGRERIAQSIKEGERALRATEGKIRRAHEEEGSIYMEYRSGEISQKEYVAFKIKQEDRLTAVRKQQEEQQKEIKTLEKLQEKYLSAVKALLKLKSGKELTKDMIVAFISKIYVYPGKRIEVLFAFTADCMEGVK